MIRIVEYTGDANILKRLEIPQEDYDRVVKDIVEAVRERKDEAVREYTAKFDKVEIT
ncbi:MAG: histidinol dehydrogenase, partial [Bianqueaceae bacterium]